MRSPRDRIDRSDALTSSDLSERRGPAARAVRVARGALGALLPIFAVAFAALMLVPAVLGYHRYVVTGGSMSGAYDRGSIVYDRAAPVADLRVGDVITYEPPGKSGVQGYVTHRIVSIRTSEGRRVFRTRGDANDHADPWRFTLREPTQARVAFAVPWAGYAFAALGVRPLRMLLIGVPALLIAALLLARLWREAGEEARQMREAEGQHARMQGTLAQSG